MSRLSTVAFSLVAMGMAFSPLAAHGDAPLVGEEIQNQGSVSYVDGDGIAQLTTTNLVVLTVQQVYSASIDEDRTATVAAGSQILFYHRLENTGNGTDEYVVNVANTITGGDDLDYESIQIIQDINQNGLADAGEPIVASLNETGIIIKDAGGSSDLIVVGDVPDTATAADTLGLTLTIQGKEGTAGGVTGSVTDLGVGKGLDGVDDTNEDLATVSADAILIVTKTSSYDDKSTPDTDDDEVSYTVRIENTGLQTARDVILSDLIPPGTSFVSLDSSSGDYVGGPGDDGANGSDGSVPAFFAGPDRIEGEIDTLAAGLSVDFTFTVGLDAALDAATEISNTAEADGDLDNNNLSDEAAVFSNTVIDVVPDHVSVALTDTGVGSSAGVNDGGDDDGTVNDIQLVDAVGEGTKVRFTLTVANTGNKADDYGLAPSIGTFPPGSVFTYYHADGQTPLVDRNGDGLVDTPRIVAGTSINIVIDMQLPASVTKAAASSATLSARSNFDASVSDPATMTLNSISVPVVDIANSAGAAGFNDGGLLDADPAAAVTTSLPALPGESVTFSLHVANEGANQDSYRIAAFSNAAATAALPDGWQVTFTDGNSNVSNHTAVLNPGDTTTFLAAVSSPASSGAITQNVYFQVLSVVTNAADIKLDEVVVAQEGIKLTPDQTGTADACGSAEYLHVLENTGNTAEAVEFTLSPVPIDFTTVLFLPTSATGQEADNFVPLDSLSIGDNVFIYDDSAAAWVSVALVTNGATGVAVPLDPEDDTRLLARVFVPCSVPAGTIDAFGIRADVISGTASSSVTDVTTVASTTLTLTKLGALDALCDGTADSAFVSANVEAKPNECVIWQISAVNRGNEALCSVTIFDRAPLFTVLDGTPGGEPTLIDEPPPGSGTCISATPNVSCTAGNDEDINGDAADENFCLRGGEQAVMQFRVRVQ